MPTLTAAALQHECLDALVWRVLQAGAGIVEQVLGLNPGIEDVASAMPEGLVVLLPVVLVSQPVERQLVKLWD